MELEDAVLWARSGDGDVDAFTTLFERHAKAIYNYCFRRVGDWGAAEDLLSIVFLEAWRRRRKQLPPDTVPPRLYGIAPNVVRNRRRAERRYRAALARVPAPRFEPDFGDELEARLDDERLIGRGRGRRGQLPAGQQDLLVLCEWSELSYDDPALALGLPVGTVRSRLSRARSALRELQLASGHASIEKAYER